MMSFFASFTDIQNGLLVCAVLLFMVSLVLHVAGKEIPAVGLLLLCAGTVFSFAILLDPFLNIWDERFHALVAKNMMNHPLMPTLYDDPVADMKYDRWDRYYIWLHKPPLFLWQIAISFKLFGINEFALRLPGVILGIALVFAAYRTGRILVNKRVGFLTGVLIITSVFIIELLAGRQAVDHNDVSFMVYVSLSIWSFIEYHHSGKRAWIVLIGLFSGLAVLCKWLTGLLVYLGWIILRLQERKYRWRENRDLAISILLTVIIALPWQLLILSWYPAEALLGYRGFTNHLFIPLDWNEGSIWYHLDKFNDLYGRTATFFVIPAFFVLMKQMRDRKLFYSLAGMILAVYIFFSVAATKMPSFTILVCMIIFIAFAALVDFILSLIERKVSLVALSRLIVLAAVIMIVFLRFDLPLLRAKHTLAKEDNVYTRMLSHNKEVFTSLQLPPNSVIFNVKGRHYIEAMFYTGLPSYNFIPSKSQYDDLRAKGRVIAIFVNNGIALPDHLMNDTAIIQIKKEVQGYE